MTTDDRFWAKVRKSDDCWIWTGRIAPNGYGLFGAESTSKVYAHRFAYEQAKGPIPDGLEIDHTCHGSDQECAGGTSCRHRRCVNPDHLEVVTHRENMLRGQTVAARSAAATHCPEGHELAGENLYLDPRGHRQCRACRRDASRRSYAKHREKRTAEMRARRRSKP